MEVLLERSADAPSACLIGSRAMTLQDVLGYADGPVHAAALPREADHDDAGLVEEQPANGFLVHLQASATSATVKTTSGTEFVPTTEAYGFRTREACRPTTLSAVEQIDRGSAVLDLAYCT
jgi:hypothetical protein